MQGSAGTKGAVYRKMVAGRSGLSIPAELEITQARPGAEIQFRVTSGPSNRSGGYYLSTENDGTRLRYALEARPEGPFSFLDRFGLLNRIAQRRVRTEVSQLDRLKDVLELQTVS